MPWETNPVTQRMQLICELLKGQATVVDLSAAFGVSRKTAYKWKERFAQEGPDGLKDRSREAHRKPHVFDDELRASFIEFRKRRPHWGPKKLLKVLREKKPHVERWPAPSTISCWLDEAGLVERRGPRRRKTTSRANTPMTEPQRPNHVWAGDFKGWFLVGDGQCCNPLTISDLYSRKLLLCQTMETTTGELVWDQMIRAFEEYGMPWVYRSDGGPPFGGPEGTLSWLTVQLVKHGICHEIIRPGKPCDNGSHERMHRTLKQETAMPPASDLVAQQGSFDAFRYDFNEQRPHEALDQETPESYWEPSPRPFHKSAGEMEMEYEGWFHVRRVQSHGQIKWRGARPFISSVLAGELVGLEEVENDVFRVWFGPVFLGLLDLQRTFVRGVTVGVRVYPGYKGKK